MMTSQISHAGFWTPARFWTVTLTLFILQAGLIWALAERDHKSLALNDPEFAVRLAVRPVDQAQLATALFAEDPTLFQAPDPRGFSGRAWMSTASPAYHAAEAPAPEAWLSLEGGVWKPDPLAIPFQNEPPLALAAPPASEFAPAEIFLALDPPPPGSAMRLTGGLARRPRLGAAPALPSQPGVQLLKNSVVQLAVDPSGEVISARLTGNSGSPSADATALATARLLRFAPITVARAAVSWGEAVFSWQTIEPPAPSGN
jgi:TonB family protein